MSGTCARLPGWEMALANAIEAARGRVFRRGTHDCVMWVSEVRCALTGIDAAAPWRGSYRSLRGARRAIAARGFATISDWVTDEMGAPLASVLLAQRGDIVMEGETGALGICTGPDAAFVAPEGLTRLPLDRCTMAWAV